MAKAYLIILVSLAICILSSLNFAYGAASDQNKFTVVGLVYCDTCRVEFQTSISEPISGATVKLECKNRTTEKITFQSPEITTDNLGNYKIEVTGDYEDSDCDVNLVKSPRADCNDPTEAWRKARVELTALDGVTGQFRFANNLGFKRKKLFQVVKSSYRHGLL